jgi:enoyl-CoA hydratase/carnithine racemase
MADGILWVRDDGAGVRILTLNRPHCLNALDLALCCALRDAVRAANSEPSVRALVLAGEGGSFCTGADLKRDRAAETSTGLDLLEVLQEAFLLLRQGGKPGVAAIEGHTLGAGLSLALACDFLVAGASAQLGAPFTSAGLAPDLGISLTLPERVGIGPAREMLLLGAIKSADKALALGLVDEVCDAGSALTRAVERARALAMRAPLALAAARQLLAASGLGIERHLSQELQLQRTLRATQDAAEAAAAFAEKRPPRFLGI